MNKSGWWCSMSGPMWVRWNSEGGKRSWNAFQNWWPSSWCLPTHSPSTLLLCVIFCALPRWDGVFSVDLFFIYFFIVLKWLENSWPQQAVSACLSPLSLFTREAIHTMGGFPITPVVVSLMFLLPHSSSVPLFPLVYCSVPVFFFCTLPR